MTERRLIPVATFPAASAMVIDGDDLARLIAEAEARAKAARIAAEAQTKPPAETAVRTVLAVFGARASGWF